MKSVLYIGSDHAGFQLKERLKLMLRHEDFVVHDLGNMEYDQNDEYPMFAKLVADKVSKGLRARGILVNDNGVGMCIAANKIKGIRAFVAYNESLTREIVTNINANIICLGQEILDMKSAEHILQIFLHTSFNSSHINKKMLKQISILS